MKRRTFAQGFSAMAMAALAPRKVEAQRAPGRSVAVFGGGVGGMSAAHELAERGFAVTVYEKRAIPGGKARSMGAPGTGKAGRRDLPGEHGFRFFPGFYKHVTDTMKRIPYGRNANGVFDNLVAAQQVSMSVAGGRHDIVSSLAPLLSIESIRNALTAKASSGPALSDAEIAFFVQRMVQFLTSCEQRRATEYEKLSWWEFIGADRFSDEYKKFLAVGLTRNLVAARAEEANARTVATILCQFLVSTAAPDRLLNGPTNDVWIEPWLAHLSSLGVRYCREATVEYVHMERGRVAGVNVRSDGLVQRVVADHYVFAMPLDATLPLLNADLIRADPSLQKLFGLHTAWMNGIQLYFDRPLDVARGHTIYLDSPWALTSVTQQQFWPNFDLRQFGDGRVRDVLSVDISNFDDPGVLFGKPARLCTKQEICQEVMAQLALSLNDSGTLTIDPAWLVDWFLDPSLVFSETGELTTADPLLINTKNSSALRPGASTAIDNLYFAADFVRCNVDLASMEAANEAARDATNAILDRTGSWAPRCARWALEEPAVVTAARLRDYARFVLGLPNLWA